MTKKILGIVAATENQTLEFATDVYVQKIIAIGHPVDAIEVINVATVGGMQRLQSELQSGTVNFCYALQGVGSRLAMGNGDSVWTHFKTPFLSIHHDNPSSNIYNHFCDSPYVANLYVYESYYDIQKRYVKSDQINAWMPYETSVGIVKEKPFAERPCGIVFLKSGRDPIFFTDKLKQISSPLRESIFAALDELERNPNLVICDLLTKAFTLAGHKAEDHWNEFWGFADLMENYLRAKRAAILVQALMNFKDAIIIGDGWDFLDKTKSKAIFRPAISATESVLLYTLSKFICNTLPYGSDILHERMTIGLTQHALVISDSNAWWDKNFGDVPSLFRIKLHEDVTQQLKDILALKDLPERSADMTGYKRVDTTLWKNEHAGKMFAHADEVRAFAQLKGK